MLTCNQLPADGLLALKTLLAHAGLHVLFVRDNTAIPGTYWGEPEAGLVGNRLFLRSDTPVHSALHEACHYILMDDARRASLHTDAGGEFIEEDAVCYLQIQLADRILGCSTTQMQADMDAWGYTFRLGSAKAWYEQDSKDAQMWLQSAQLGFMSFNSFTS